VVWMQPGAENEAAAATARAAGLTAIVGPCIYAEHQRLTGKD
jgi:predicted CoA-binding protein